jgi:hypothetical protein
MSSYRFPAVYRRLLPVLMSLSHWPETIPDQRSNNRLKTAKTVKTVAVTSPVR